MLASRLDFCERLNALGAQVFRHRFPVFHHVDTLDVRFELAARVPHREAAGVAEHRFLPAILTDCHQLASGAFLTESNRNAMLS